MKWKKVPKELYRDGRINVKPKLDLSQLRKLLEYRHGLIHASASRPFTKAQPPEERPFPRKEDLKAVEPGWATRVAFELVASLSHQLGEPKPDYLEAP